MQYMKWKWVAKGIVFGTLFVTAITFASMFLWNNLAVGIFGLPALTFFQTMGLMILGRLLTGGFSPRGWGGRHRMGGHYMKERWKNMSPEQREQLTQRWGKRGWGPMGGAEGDEFEGRS
jgi:hypothetical protein